MKDTIFKICTHLATAIICIIGLVIFFTFLYQAIPAIKEFGFFHFLTSPEWSFSDNAEKYGAFYFIVGSVLVSLIAIFISIPFSFSLAIVCQFGIQNEVVKYWFVRVIDFMAFIPTVIYGVWGYYVVLPLFADMNLESRGYGLLTTSIVLAVMIIPYIAFLLQIFLKKIPFKVIEGAYSLGYGTSDVVFRVALPSIKKGISATYILSIAKVMGESMIATILIGNTISMPKNILDSGSTMTSVLLNLVGSSGDLRFSSLFAIAFILFLITMLFNTIAKYIIRSRYEV